MSDTIQVTDNDITLFREWLEKQPFLPQYVDDNLIRCFIIGAKGSVQIAKKIFNNYYKNASTLDEIFGNGDIFSEKAEKFNQTWSIFNLPKKTPEGYTVEISRAVTHDPTNFDVKECFLRHFFNLHMNILEGEFGNGEYVLILDATGVQLAHCKTLTPALVDRVTRRLIKGCPVRIKGIHLIGVPSMLEWGISLFNHLLPEKIKNRLTVHSNYDSLFKHFPKKILPSDLGGEEESCEKLYEKHLMRARKYREVLIEEQKNRMEERKLRPKTEEEDDIPGTFRKLTVD